jgi:hypothetical protein
MTNPLRALYDFTGTLHFDAAGSIDSAVARLAKSITKTPLMASLTNETYEETLVGIVSEDRVRLHKVMYLRGNIFKPIFEGQFQSKNGDAQLVGSFRMASNGRFTIALGLAVSIISQIIALPLIGTKTGIENLSLFAPTAFGLIGLALAWSGKTSGQNDVEWIERQIERALSQKR